MLLSAGQVSCGWRTWHEGKVDFELKRFLREEADKNILTSLPPPPNVLTVSLTYCPNVTSH